MNTSLQAYIIYLSVKKTEIKFPKVVTSFYYYQVYNENHICNRKMSSKKHNNNIITCSRIYMIFLLSFWEYFWNEIDILQKKNTHRDVKKYSILV